MEWTCNNIFSLENFKNAREIKHSGVFFVFNLQCSNNVYSMQSSSLFSSEFKEGKIKQHKKRANYTINKHTIDRFKVVVDKDMRKMSNVVENLIR